ncbi:hypothetical protein NE865_08398 [Phthorimaea operculella]|nr:hypothetical protein NE865_08398 [Phthorimaea operculella]
MSKDKAQLKSAIGSLKSKMQLESLEENPESAYAEREKFYTDYYAQQKVKWATTSGDLQLGTLVLVRDRNQPPLLWLLGRIIKIYPGPDNVNRVADIRTKKGIMQRSFNNICPLPTSS